jgi:hypothetical protein
VPPAVTSAPVLSTSAPASATPAPASSSAPAASSSGPAAATTAGAPSAPATTASAAVSVAPSTAASASAATSAQPSTTASGSSGPAPATLVGTIDRGGGKYVLEFGDIYFEAEKKGGRITAFSIGGKEVLLGKNVAASDIVYGSTFDLSPQHPKDTTIGSCWPPAEPIDLGDYTFSAGTGAQIVLTSPPAKIGFTTCPSVSGSDPLPDTGSDTVVVTKTFTPLLDKGAVQVDYAVKNGGTAAIKWAPWRPDVLPDGPGRGRAKSA